MVILPALNESDGIRFTIEEALRYLEGSSIIVVDGCSTDGTPEIAAESGAWVVIQRGRGKGAAIKEGIKYVKEGSLRPRYIVICDADYSYSLRSTPEMVNLIAKNPAVGMVIGERFHSLALWDYFKNRYTFGNLILKRIHRVLNGVKLRDPLSGLRVLRFEAVRDIAFDSDGFDLEAELNCRLHEEGWEIREVPIVYRQRRGKKKLRVIHGFAILWRMMKHAVGRRLVQSKVSKRA